MKKKLITLGIAFFAGIMLCACGSSKKVPSSKRDKEIVNEGDYFLGMIESESNNSSKDPVSQDTPQASKNEDAHWDGEWVSDDVTVKIKWADTPDIEVRVDETEMHSNLMDAVVSGNTITGGIGIGKDNYGEVDSGKNLPEQDWSITLVKNGATMTYTRNNHLTWYDDAGRITKEEDREKTATLTKIIKQEN